MCGLVGFWQIKNLMPLEDVRFLAESIKHRGPDDVGVWFDSNVGLALAHRRLSIIDLSPAGHQPMHSSSQRFVTVFNGEIYNHNEIRNDLMRAGRVVSWRGHSDTETILAAVDAWGVEKTLQQLVGMFALVLWDKQKQQLVLARDRMGEKPLYFGWQGDTFLFGSELKAIRKHPAFLADLNRDVLPIFFRHGYVPAPHSIYSGIHKLQPGHYVVINSDDKCLVASKAYWSLETEISKSYQSKSNLDLNTAVDELDFMLRRSIRDQMVADVPLGAFLSGGVDSSAVVALMQSQSSMPIKTFSIGFEDDAYNEAEHAKAVAKHLGTDHTELYITPNDALSVVPLLPILYDEPLGDSSQIPTYLVSKLARQHVTVSLSGDGGDELFGGYSRYSNFRHWNNRLSKVPSPLRQLAAHWVNIPIIRNLMTSRGRGLRTLMLSARDSVELFRGLNSHWLPMENVVLSHREASYWANSKLNLHNFNDPVDWAMLYDSLTYLPDDVLTKVDRAAMAVSLETRVPLLDHRIVEWAWALPQSLKSGGTNQKCVLRELLYRYVPRKLIDRPKMGFGVPIDKWLRGPLKDWAVDLLDPVKMNNDGILNAAAIKEKWVEHQDGRMDWQYLLWDVLMFQAWLRSSAEHDRV